MLDFEAAGVSNFVLRPSGEGDTDIFDQTRLINEVIPAVLVGQPSLADACSADVR